MLSRISAAVLAATLVAGCGPAVELRSPEFKRTLTSGQDALAPDVADCAIGKLTAQGYETEDQVPQERAEQAGADCAGDLRASPFREALSDEDLSPKEAECATEKLTAQGYETVDEVPEHRFEKAGYECAELRGATFREELTSGEDALSSDQADCLIDELTGQGYERVTRVPEKEVEKAAAGCRND